MKRFIAILLAAMLFVAVMPTSAFAASTKTVYVSRNAGNSRIYFRSGAGYDYPQRGTVYHGDKVTVQSTSGVWSKVKIVTTKGSYQGSTGWIRTYYIDGTTKTMSTGSRAIKAATKIYASASTKSAVRGTLAKGTAVTVYYFEQDFAKVVVNGSGTYGWVPMRLIGAKVDTTPEPPKGGAVYYVTASVLNVRSGPGTNYKVINQLRRGTACTVLESYGNWFRIKTVSGGIVGWVSKTYMSKRAGTTARVATRGGNLNVRTRPSINATILGSLPNGTVVSVGSISGNWAYVSGRGLTGWASMSYLKF